MGLNRLAGKVAIVSGASKGIGKVIASVYAAEGAKVVLFARSEEALKANVEAIKAAGGEASYVVADCTSEADCQQVVDFTLATYGTLDILVVNAGYFTESRVEDMTVKEWDDIFATNLRGMFLQVKAALPPLKEKSYGRIVLISSISGNDVGLPGFSHYCATKAGMNGWMKAAAIELAKYKITVNAIQPGNILTEALADISPEYLKQTIDAIPMGKLGACEDIAYTAVFFGSAEAGFISGQGLTVDGGQVLPESHYLDF